MRTFFTRYPVISFILMTYALTSFVWLLILQNFGARSIEDLFATPVSVAAVYAGAAAPTFVAILLTAIQSGRAGLRALFAHVILLRVSPILWVIALGVPIFSATLATFFVAGDLGPASLPAWYAIIPPSALILFFAGPLCEEIGWRGYLQPSLLLQMSPMKAAFVLGTVWCFWHVPLSFTPGATPLLNGIEPWGRYWLSASASSAIMMAIVVAGRGSIALAMAYHWSSNAAISQILQPIFPFASLGAWENVDEIVLIFKLVLAVGCLIWVSCNASMLLKGQR